MAKKIKRYKVGMDSETYKISMVSEPAIEVDYVALSKQDEVEVKLSSDERHICYGPALIPNKDIYRNNGENEFYINFTEESIVKMSQEFMKDYRQHEVNLQHEDNADEVFVCESWIVEDPYRDKSNALGFNVPKGTWMVAMKVNNIDVWDRVKAGELKGFSVESMISLEEFSKNDNNMINVEEMSFWTKMKEVLAEAFSKKDEDLSVNSGITGEATQEDLEKFSEETGIEVVSMEEEPAPQEPQAEPQPTVEQPKVEEPAVEEPKPTEEPKTEEPKPQEETPKADNSHLEELIGNLKAEIEALKEMNNGLKKEIKNLGKQPSAAPVNTNSKPNGGVGVGSDTYKQWRETMRQMVG